MNKDLQAKIDAKLPEDKTPDRTQTNIPDKPISIDAIFESDARKVETVEINIASQNAIAVASSDAPELTADVIAEEGKLTKVVDLVFEDQVATIEVLNGISLAVEIERAKLNQKYADRELTKKEEYTRNLETLQLIVARLVVSPKFSFQGEGEGTPVEERSDFLLEAFYKAVAAVVYPVTLISSYAELQESLTFLNEKLTKLETELAEKQKAAEKRVGRPTNKHKSEVRELERQIATTQTGIEMTEASLGHIYQVKVHRGSPLHAALLTDSFEMYPTGDGTPVLEMPDEMIQAHIKRTDAERNAFVASMILSPALSWNAEGDTGAYPVEQIGESFLQTLYNAHKAVNVKSGGLDMLQRFRQVGQNGIRQRSGT